MFLRTALLVCLSGAISLCYGVDTAPKKPDPTPGQIQQIIKSFIQKETEFAGAREGYTYKQLSKLDETDPPGGGYEMLEEVTFDDRDRRTSRVLHAPVTSLQNIIMTSEDEQDFRNTMPFAISVDTASNYDIKYLGHEQVDEISCYVFSLQPKQLDKTRKRYFQGQVWVDDQDLQIVKTYGRGIGHKDGDQQFPKFTTYREQIDGKFWFPTYTYADDTLNFKGGQSQRVKVVVKYYDYKKYKFKSESAIQYGNVEGSPAPAAPPPPKQK